MITHMVLLRFRSSATKSEIDGAFTTLAALKGKVPGLLSFRGGSYSSPEGLSKGFTHGFVMTFQSAASRDGYLPHPEHERVKAMIFPLLEGGLDGVIAFDYGS